MEKPLKVYPLRLSFLSDGRYELEIVDDNGVHQVLICTVFEGDITYVRSDPDPFMQSLTDPRPIYAAVVAFHRACTWQRISPTPESD